MFGKNILGISNSFKDCTSLETIVIPYTVTDIDEEAFYNCSSLKTVIVGDAENGSRLKMVRTCAFGSCKNLADFYLYTRRVPKTDQEYYLSGDVFRNSYVNYATLHVPADAIDDYRVTYPWNEFGKFEAVGETAIRDVRLGEGVNNAPYYDLNGMRISQPRKGIYIRNGKKVVL